MSTIPEGWVAMPTQAFGAFVGPFYQPTGGDSLRVGFATDERHANKRGVTQGGMLATAFDIALGNACWTAVEQRPCATVQLAIQYVGALKLGEFGVVQPEIVRATSSLVFVRGVMSAGDRVIATADGVWKVLNWRGAPFVPADPISPSS